MSVANDLEQQMLDLINNERAIAGLDPLAFNGLLNDASEIHSQWMLDADVFSHQGDGGSSPTVRMADAGYRFEGNWTSGENIAYQSERGEPGLSDDVVDLHAGLMNSPGHRANILSPDFTEIGIGIEAGDFQTGGNVFDAIVVTQNFARSDADNPDDADPAVPDDDQIAQPGDPVDDPDAGETPVPGDDMADGGDDDPQDDGGDTPDPDDMADGGDTPDPDDMADGGDDTPQDDEDPVPDADDDTPDTPEGDDDPDDDLDDDQDDEPEVAEGCDLDLDALIAALSDGMEFDGVEMFEFTFGGETYVGYAVDADLLIDAETPVEDAAGDDDPMAGDPGCCMPCEEVPTPVEDMEVIQARTDTQLAASYGDCMDIV